MYGVQDLLWEELKYESTELSLIKFTNITTHEIDIL